MNNHFDMPSAPQAGDKSIACPDCRGTGRVTYDSRANYPGKVSYVDCETCGGSGELGPDLDDDVLRPDGPAAK